MLLPDGTTLMHDGTPYDPAKAHQYYLQYRKLHPREAAAQDKTNAREKKTTFTVLREGKAIKLTPEQLAEQKAYAAARVLNVKKKLSALNAALQKKLAAAETAAAKAGKPLTAAEKASAARDAAAYRAKHKTALAVKAKTAAAKAPAKAAAKKSDTVASLRDSIAVAKTSLTIEVNRQRTLSAAKKNG